MEDEIVMDAVRMILGQSDGFEYMNCKFVDKFKDFVCAFFFRWTLNISLDFFF